MQFQNQRLRTFLRGLIFGLILLRAMSGWSAGLQVLAGHVPTAVAGLAPVGKVASARQLRLGIGLPLRNQPALSTLLENLYNPASPSFHHYLTSAQFTQAFGPTEKDYQSVIAFAKSCGLTVVETHPNRALLEVTGSVADIEKAFHFNLRGYQHPTEPRTFYAPDAEPALDLSVPVLAIAGLNDFFLPHPAIHHSTLTPNAGSQAGNYVGADFRSAYVPGVALTGAGESVGLVEFDGYYPADITSYTNLPTAGLGSSAVTLTNVQLAGFTGPPGSGNEEVALDIDMAIAMAPGLTSIIVYEAPNNTSSSPEAVLTRMATDNLARQLSCSWTGFSYPDTIIEQAFQQFAVQGQSFFIASGDTGAYFTGPNRNQLQPPVDDAYVTTVGGTTLSTATTNGPWTAEKTWNWFATGQGNAASSGGSSTHFAVPIWQAGVPVTGAGGSTNFRNIPDVAMAADSIYIFASNGIPEVVGGTSAAAPLWAGFAALVNQQNAALGQPPVGFMNPALYHIARGPNYLACFHDIATGNNTNLRTSTKFFATNGYDLCTGWGSPIGSNLIAALTQNPANNATIINGGFETGDAFGWTTAGSGSNLFIVSTSATFGSQSLRPYLHSGSFAAFLGVPSDLGFLLQSVPTFPGQPYLISFWFSNPGTLSTNDPTPNEFQVLWDNHILFDGTNIGVITSTNMQFIVTAASTNSVLEFGFRNDPDAFGLDDVGVQAVPAPIFQSAARANGNVTLTWSALTGLSYQIQYATDLGAGNWTNLGNKITATNGTVVGLDVAPGDPSRVYRLVLLP